MCVVWCHCSHSTSSGGSASRDGFVAPGIHRRNVEWGAKLLDELAASNIELRRFVGPSTHADQLDHVRVAHLTDLHVGRVTPHKVQVAAVELTNEQEPDLVVISGDFVAHSQMFLDQLTEIIGAIEAPVIGVLGNHDHWSGAREVKWALHQGGAAVLDNAWTTVTVRGQALQVVGLDDAYTGHANIEAATKGLDRTAPTIGVSHIAEEADALWDRGVPIVFSGHTHAGQVTLAKLHEFILGRVIGHRYIHGLYGARVDDCAVYVGAGIGSAVMPVRLGKRARREVAVFELGHELGAIDEHHEEQEPRPGRPPSQALKLKRQAEAALKSSRRRAAARKKGINPLAE